MIKAHANEIPGLRFGDYSPVADYPHRSAQTFSLLEKLLASAHEGAISLTGAWPAVKRNSYPTSGGEATLITTSLNADGTRLPTLGKRMIAALDVMHEYGGRKLTPDNTRRLSVITSVYNQGPATGILVGTNVSIRMQSGKGIDTMVYGEGPFTGGSPQAHILGVVAATQAIRDGAAGVGGELTARSAIDYSEVCGVLSDWEEAIPGHLGPLLVRMEEHGYDTSRVAPSLLVTTVV